MTRRAHNHSHLPTTPPLEARFYPRAATRLQATLHVQGSIVEVELRDISEGGMGVFGQQALAVGQRITLMVLLPGAPRTIAPKGVITWSRTEATGALMGLELLELAPDEEAIIQSFVEQVDPLWWE